MGAPPPWGDNNCQNKLWLAWPPHVWLAPILLIGLVPLFISLENIANQKQKKNGKRIFLTAGLTFLVWNTASIYWVFNAISAFNEGFVGAVVAFFVSLIPYGLGALLMTFAFWLYYRLQTITKPVIAYLGLISFFISMEYLHESWELAFPWMTLGNGFAGMHQLAQWYEYTGIYGGSLWILLSNIFAFEAYKAIRFNNTSALKPIVYWAVVVILPLSFSLYTYFNYEEKSVPINVVTVQPNIDPYERYGNISATDQIATLVKLSDSVAQVNTEYFLWPETAIPRMADEEKIRTNPDYLQAQQFLNKYSIDNFISTHFYIF